MKKVMLIVAMGLIGSSLLVGCGNDKKDTSNQESTTQSTQATNNSSQYDKVYKSGFYEVGKDLPAGEYLVVGDKITKEAETSVAVTKDSKKEDEIFDESVMGNVYVTLEKGQFLSLIHI